jgi:hypothetical protein
MSLIANLVARFTADTAGFEKGTQKARQSLYGLTAESAKTQQALLGMARTTASMLGLGAGLYGVKQALSAVVGVASEAEETTNKFNVVFRDQASAARQWAEGFGDSVGRSTQDVQKWMASLQDLFVPLGFARDKSFELSKSLTELAVDVASFNNQADAEVIRDFTSALVGNYEAVRKYGIIITEASLKQEALRKGFSKSFQELSNLEKVALRYGIIQQSTADAQGDALRTTDSYANQVKRLSANFHDMKVEIGEQLLPAMTNLIRAVNDSREAWGWFFRTMGNGLAEIIRLPETIEAVGTIAEQKLPKPEVWTWQDVMGLRAGPEDIGKPKSSPMISPRANQLLAEQRAAAREMEEAALAPQRALADLKAFTGPLPGTEGGRAAAELSNTEKLIAAMKRENELAAMTQEERAVTLAVEKYREAVQKDIEAGALRGVELTVDEKAAVEKLAAEHLRLSDTAKESTVDIAAAYARMYEQIDSKSAASFEARRQLIQNDYTEYDKVIKDKHALNMWFLDQQKKLDIEEGAARGGPWEGILASMDELGREALSVGEMFKEATITGVEGFSDALAKAIVRGDDLGDSMRALGLDIAQMFAKQAILTGISGGFGAIFGTTVPAMHGGGIAGRDRSGMRTVNPAIFAHAPRLHGGLAPDEFPAILQAGERVQSRAEVSRGGSSNQRLEALMGQVVTLLSQRQNLTLNANIVDKREVVTRSQMEGRDGEKWTMYHVGRNG